MHTQKGLYEFVFFNTEFQDEEKMKIILPDTQFVSSGNYCLASCLAIQRSQLKESLANEIFSLSSSVDVSVAFTDILHQLLSVGKHHVALPSPTVA